MTRGILGLLFLAGGLLGQPSPTAYTVNYGGTIPSSCRGSSRNVFFKSTGANPGLYECDPVGLVYTKVPLASGGGIVNVATGAADPVAVCTAPATGNLTFYVQTTTSDLWMCIATNTWKKLLSTTNVGTYVEVGLAGTAPANPATGYVTTYFDSTHGTQVSLDSAGVAKVMVKADTGVAHNFLTAISLGGIVTKARPNCGNLSDSAGGCAMSTTAGGDLSGTLPSPTLAAPYKVRSCVVAVGDPGAASSVLADDNDSPVACGNTFGADWTIQSVTCWANAGSPTVTPILTGGTGTSILTGALTCGTASWAAGTVQGTAPVVHTFSGTGATCSVTPCTIDANITTAGGVAKYIVIRITGTL